MLPLALIAAGFAAGSTPFGVLLAKRRGVDITTQGSGNIGATNVARVLGLKAGVVVLILDAAKGALPVVVALHTCGMGDVAALTGGAAIAGHCFSPWLGGKGGKGVATALGVFAVLTPWATVLACCMFAGVYAKTRVAAFGSLSATATLTLTLIIMRAGSCMTLAIATTALLIYTHRDNIRRAFR